jgi:hypothetical protein
VGFEIGITMRRKAPAMEITEVETFVIDAD